MRFPLILAAAWAVQTAATVRAATGDVREEAVDVYYVPKLLDKFLHYSEERSARSESMHDLERTRLEAALQEAKEPLGREMLTKTVEENELSRLEMRNVLNEMGNFVNSLKTMMGGGDNAESCESLTCGDHASCGIGRDGAECSCDEGYVGDGFICEEPKVFLAKPLLPANMSSTQVTDLSMSRLGSTLLVTFRTVADDRGYVVAGQVTPAHVKWSQPMPFGNGSSVFSPQATLIPEDRFVIAFRDANENGDGFVVGGQFLPGESGGFRLELGSPQPFARRQAHQMAVVPLPGARFACFFNDHKAEGEEYGSALLGQVDPGGKLSQQGVFVFAESAVTRLTATLLSGDSFVIAYRAPVDTSANALTIQYNEANCAFGKLAGNDIVFDPTPLRVDPGTTELWDRGLGVLTANRFQYAYQSGNEDKTKLAIVEVDRVTHKMRVTSKLELAQGFTPFARSVGLAYAPKAPRSFVYFEKSGMGRYSTCAVSPDGVLSDCTEHTWNSSPVDSVAAVALGDSRVLFVYTNKDGIPSYQVSVLE